MGAGLRANQQAVAGGMAGQIKEDINLIPTDTGTKGLIAQRGYGPPVIVRGLLAVTSSATV